MTFDEQTLTKKFENVSNSQDNIQSLSLWMLHYSNHANAIISTWYKVFEKSKPSHRLTLFYLANDVIQNEKRKKKPANPYLTHFMDVLKLASAYLRDEKIVNSVLRVLGIWKERSVFTPDYIEELKIQLSSGPPPVVKLPSASKIVAEFKLQTLITPITEVKEMDRKAQISVPQSNARLDVLNVVLNRLKDKTHSEQYSREVDDLSTTLEVEIQRLEQEIFARNKLTEHLDKSQIYYETQREEARIISNAYNNFYARVCSVRDKLKESSKHLKSSVVRTATAIDSSSFSSNTHSFQNNVASIQQIVNDEHQTSLDQRLSSLMKNITGTSMPARNDITLPPALQDILQIPQSSNNAPPSFIMPAGASPLERVAASHPSLNAYDPSVQAYDPAVPAYDPSMYAPALHQSNFHQIQSVVSARADVAASSLGAPSGGVLPYGGYGTHENFEPSDMDLGNSDEDETHQRPPPYIPSRLNNNLKVIEPQRHDDRYGVHDGHHYPQNNEPLHDDWRNHGPRSVIASRHNYNPQKEAFQLAPTNDYGRNKPRQNQSRHNNRRGNFPR